MLFNINIPTTVFSGEGCVKANSKSLILGQKAFIVCGAHGAKNSGALDDVCNILSDAGVKYDIFNKVNENPSIKVCYEGGNTAQAFGADFIIGIGGGSSMDAAKAIAAYAVNTFVDENDIFDSEKFRCKPLPMVLIPTTSGTGSELNPYSVLTLADGVHKKSFNSVYSWAKVAFLDPAYTMSLPHSSTVSCALDAFAHGIESYLSPKSTAFSEMLAMFAMKKIWNVLTQYPENFSYAMREDLLYASAAAGIAISITGTGFPHPLGYSITLLDGIPHGAACAVFEDDYISYNEKTDIGAEKLNRIYKELNTTSKIMKEFLPALSEVELEFTQDEISERVELICNAKNYANSPYVITKEEIYDIYNRHFLKKRGKGNA